MFWRDRSFWVAASATAYASFAALRASSDSPAGWICLFALPALLAAGWTVTARPARGEDRIDEGARAAARVCITGAAMLVAARSGPDTPALVALSNLGVALASIASLVALARMAPLGGLAEPPPSARRLDAAAFGSLLWTVAIALPALRVLAPERSRELHPVAIEYATVAASLSSLGVGIAAAFRARASRYAELGTSDRVSAALSLNLTALAIGLLAALAGVLPPERILPITAAVAAIATAWSSTTRDPTRVSRLLRTTLAVASLAVPPALAAVYAAQMAPGRVGGAIFLACAGCALAGVAAPLVEKRFAPEGARWLSALGAATRAAMNPDPDDALTSALRELRAAAGQGAPPPALYRLDPPEIVSVDRAGFTHVQRAEVPRRLIELADLEPERVLRIEVLRAVEVRRPEVRPILMWLAERGIAAMAVIQDASEPMGLLSVPAGGRTAPMSLEEVRALRQLTDRIGATLGVSSMLARSRDREIVLREQVAALSADRAAALDAARRITGRSEAIARMLERPARAALYSPTARAAADQLERLGQANAPVTLLVAAGIDPVPWGALSHLASPRHAGVLVIMDGANPSECDLARLRDPAESPLVLASGGTLLVLDAHAMARESQSYLGAALPAEAGLIVAVPATIDSLVASGRMHERLADRLGDRAVALPELSSRAEDFQALALSHLAQIGARLGRGPMGLEPRALAALAEHAWPGNDAEFVSVLWRAALVASGPVLGASDLEASGFALPAAQWAAGSGSGAIPIVKRKRSSR
jgi:hypothetical protein